MASRTVLVGWSGPLACRVARVLAVHLRELLPGCRFWISEGMRPGVLWFPALLGVAARADLVVLCVTTRHPGGPFQALEAGLVLGRQKNWTTGIGCVIPYAIGLDGGRIAEPLRPFNALTADFNGTWRLVYEIARQCGASTASLQGDFERAWPSIDRAIQEATALGDDDLTDMRGQWRYESKSSDIPNHRWAGILRLDQQNNAGALGGLRIEGRRTKEQTTRSGYRALPAPVAWRTSWVVVTAEGVVVFEYYIQVRRRIIRGVAIGRIVRWVRNRPVEIAAQLIHSPSNEHSELRIWRAA
jgi:hypothetical protein